jgi:hypothetical protein
LVLVTPTTKYEQLRAVTGRAPEHVGMHLDAQIGHNAGSFHYGGESGR